MTADFWHKESNSCVSCDLCPHRCMILPEKSGKCRVRKNENGEMVTLARNIISVTHVDPIEKKPLYHFHPGTKILSVGGFGCNLSCRFCQNWEISQCGVPENEKKQLPAILVELALLEKNNIGIAYTYNEPLINFEFVIECSRLIHDAGMQNVYVTNGFINPEPLEMLLPVADAFNVDLKAFSDEFYRMQAGASLQPVLNTISRISQTGKHLEITFLLIPNLNDSVKEFAEMCDWIASECGSDTVLHISRYFPRYQLRESPTPIDMMRRFEILAREKLKFVYLGNV
ncbi:MAG: AmmeMemoRadiSam system radical SAM enzyme [Bacteroidetes bacterium]|nr:AmmeMemoRadiSam system radical SAM enzyme [Bacteroidota bacterium]MBU1718850.1 AmmeMemoRadiSam system radical SAM enzyme [Bacteroidota bacterium]